MKAPLHRVFLFACVFLSPMFTSAFAAECGRSYSAHWSQYGGFFNGENLPNFKAFAALKADGSISAWGDAGSGGVGAPSDDGYVAIYPNVTSFAARQYQHLG